MWGVDTVAGVDGRIALELEGEKIVDLALWLGRDDGSRVILEIAECSVLGIGGILASN
jgi:hypothetical protein